MSWARSMLHPPSVCDSASRCGTLRSDVYLRLLHAMLLWNTLTHTLGRPQLRVWRPHFHSPGNAEHTNAYAPVSRTHIRIRRMYPPFCSEYTSRLSRASFGLEYIVRSKLICACQASATAFMSSGAARLWVDVMP